MSKVTAKFQVTIPLKVRKELNITPGTEIDIQKKGDVYVLVTNPIDEIKKKWQGKFRGEPTTMEYINEIRGKVS